VDAVNVPNWDSECDQRYNAFLLAESRVDSDFKAEELTSCLDRKRPERWIESVEGIDFTHSSTKAWKTFNRLTGRRACPRKRPVTANAIAHQLLANARHTGASKNHSLIVKRQCSVEFRKLMGTSHHLSHSRNWPMPSNCSSAGKIKDRQHPTRVPWTPWSQMPVVAAWVLLQLSQSCCYPEDLAKSDCHSCPKTEQANGQSQELPNNVASLCSAQVTWTPHSVPARACCRPPAADPTSWLSKRSLYWVWFSWILLQHMILSGIRSWHWSYSRPSLIDTSSASLSTSSQTAASTLKLAVADRAWLELPCVKHRWGIGRSGLWLTGAIDEEIFG